MSLIRLLALPLIMSAAVASAAEPPTPPAPAPVKTSADKCEVWARETSFAQAVADHDASAFAEHLHPDAVFIGGDGMPTRGAVAIAADWAGIVAGKGVVLHWYPDAVDVAGDGKVALSRGPYWIDNPAQAADKRYHVGHFISTWLRGKDGRWHVVFDGGGGNVPVAATAADIAALEAGRKACTQG